MIVKRFDAIQNLGAVSVLCSDKTGTLTIDLVRVSGSTTGSGDDSDLPLQLAYLNSALQTGTRSPLDGAIVDFTRKKFEQSVEEGNGQGIDIVKLEDYDKIAEVPFDSTRRLLSVLVSRTGTNEKGLLITKGAVEEVLERCTKHYNHPSWPASAPPFDNFKPSKSTPLTVDDRSRILETAEGLNGEGLRLIAVACKSSVAMEGITMSMEDEMDLVFVGFLGFLDPLKPDAADAISRLAKLGVQVCEFSISFLNELYFKLEHWQVRIVTGDAPAVAAKVGRDLGILRPKSAFLDNFSTNTPEDLIDQVAALPASPTAFDGDLERGLKKPTLDDKDLIITGSQLTALSDDPEAFDAAIERCIIFAKVSPFQKRQVVEGIRKGGGGNRAVAFLGDGVNDALAIREADVGISVDSGTEIAKEAADVILLEKSLDVIAHGVLEGRITYEFLFQVAHK